MDADLIVVTGDHAAGPQPGAVLDCLLALGNRGVLVRGNADRELLALASGQQIEVADEVTRWAAAQLSSDHLVLLGGLPHPVTVDIDGFGPVLFCHGTPRDDEEVVLVDTRLARWQEIFADLSTGVRTVVCGHTHMPFVRLVDRRLVINPGSIGMPYGRTGGAWALLRSGQVKLRHTSVNIGAAVAQVVRESVYPNRQPWAEEYLWSLNSDADDIRAFAPRDGR